MHTRARLCTRVHACVFGRGEACVHTRVRVHACARGVCDGWLACKRVRTRARGCPYMSKRVVGRASTRVHTRARVCMHAGTVWGGVVVYMAVGGWVRVGVVGREREAFLKRTPRAARREKRAEDMMAPTCVNKLVLLVRMDHAMSNKHIIKDRIMERAGVHGMMGRRARVHGKDISGRRARIHGKAISHNVPYACRIFFCRLVPPLLVINQSDI